MQFDRQPVSRDIHRLEKFLPKNLSRMQRPPCLTLILDTHILLLPSLPPPLSISPYSLFVVVRYLNIVGITVPEHKADTELIIDPNTVLPFPVLVMQTLPVYCREDIRKSSIFTAEFSMASFLLASFSQVPREAFLYSYLYPRNPSCFDPRSP